MSTQGLDSLESSENTIDEVIKRLEDHSRSSKRKVAILFSLLLISIMFVTSIVVIKIFDFSLQTKEPVAQVFLTDNVYDRGVDKTLENRIQSLTHSLTAIEKQWHPLIAKPALPMNENKEFAEYVRTQIMLNVDQYVKTVEAQSLTNADNTSEVIVSSVGSIVFGIGVVTFLYLYIQVSISFIKYHTRLAELYASQANALLAANGNIDRAEAFLAGLNPSNIEIDKTPSTFIDKALDIAASSVRK